MRMNKSIRWSNETTHIQLNTNAVAVDRGVRLCILKKSPTSGFWSFGFSRKF